MLSRTQLTVAADLLIRVFLPAAGVRQIAWELHVGLERGVVMSAGRDSSVGGLRMN